MLIVSRDTPPAIAMANSTDPSTRVYLAAVLLATLSLIFMLLITPPMLWHFRNRNIGATVLVAWVIVLLLFTFVNAILWPNDDISSWYNGSGLCDVEVKVQVASQVAFPASMACVLRALAAVMDTDNTTLMQSKAQRRRRYMIDLSWCVGFPLLQMLLHYVVQTRRYYIYGIAGCVPAVSPSMVTIFLLAVPPMVWTLIDSYYSVLILVRLYHYRINFNSILACNNMNKSRFMRLYIICIMWILGYIPLQAYTLYFNIGVIVHKPYSWSQTHDPKLWSQIPMFSSGGKVVYDRWIWLSCGLVVFIFFGFGRDAISMYRSALLAIGLGSVIPSLRLDHSSSTGHTISSFGSKARMLFKRKSSTSELTWSSASNTSHTSTTGPSSPPKMTFLLDTIDEPSSIEKSQPNHPDERVLVTRGDKRPAHSSASKSYFSRLTSMFCSKKTPASDSNRVLPLTELSRQPATVQSAVTSGPRTPSLMQHVRGIGSEEVVVRMEVRRNSEHGRP